MRIYCLSLGCAKNKVDSELLAGELERAGHELVDTIEKAEAGIVNTCGFIRPAVEESVGAILELEELKLAGRLRKIGVVGCLVNRYGAELTGGMPAVDFWAKSEEWNAVLAGLGDPPSGGRRRAPLPSTPLFTRYLKISEGCDNRCAYCKIPDIRGGLRSVPADVVVREAQQLVSEGARELCVVGQDLTVYGTDLNSGLIELLDALESSLPKNLWIRLLYLHPSRVTTKLLERVADGVQILPYLDIPVQHADPGILAAMNRSAGELELSSIFRLARKIKPEFALRTTCMVGFPGEGREEFAGLMSFIEQVRFDRLGAFSFFAEEGTAAAGMRKQVAETTKKRRLEKLMAAQEEISASRQRLFVGKTLDVLVERTDAERGFAEGRSFREAPEVDGVIEIHDARADLETGRIIKVKITCALEHDMVGKEVDYDKNS